MNDPRDARLGRQLSDDAMWTIVCHPTVPAPELGARLGIGNVRINKVRHALKPAGWSCRVDFVPCAHCGELVTVGGHVRRDRAYHDPRRPAARRAIQAALEQRRWARADLHERSRLLDRRSAGDQEHQQQTREAAPGMGRAGPSTRSPPASPTTPSPSTGWRPPWAARSTPCAPASASCASAGCCSACLECGPSSSGRGPEPRSYRSSISRIVRPRSSAPRTRQRSRPRLTSRCPGVCFGDQAQLTPR
jgi:hypothetical protein